ncbi:ion channel [Andreprevotia chitinilytica]|uniref:ion channel n=1 Tax=Andreprevotia chitinilytica TaxID=396808 RepID=UPI000557B7CD|nr:ion channel [Andreprevotia chitinilytica]
MPSTRPSKVGRIHVGDRDVITHGLAGHRLRDLYHHCMTISWPQFYGEIAAAFLLINTIFASLYQLDGHAIANQLPSGFAGAFFFSVETFATVGYGDMHPQTAFGHVIATLEIFMGMMNIALITGVTFARFSRPRARIMFACHPVIRPFDGATTLVLRAANARQNVIVDASAKLRLLRDEVSAEGTQIRRLYDLKLARHEHPMFVLSWTLFHVIDETSPLYGMTPETLDAENSSLLLTINGTDETTSQTLISRHSYAHGDIRWNHVYADLLYTDEEGNDHVDYNLLHEVRPL